MCSGQQIISVLLQAKWSQRWRTAALNHFLEVALDWCNLCICVSSTLTSSIMAVSTTSSQNDVHRSSAKIYTSSQTSSSSKLISPCSKYYYFYSVSQLLLWCIGQNTGHCQRAAWPWHMENHRRRPLFYSTYCWGDLRKRFRKQHVQSGPHYPRKD